MPSLEPVAVRPQIKLTNVFVSFAGTAVLHDMNLVVNPSSRIGVVGENGRGKTTLLRVITKHLEPDSGFVDIVGTLGVAEQELDAHDARTVEKVTSDAIAESLEALSALDRATEALTTGHAEAVEHYTDALARAEQLDAWGAERRVRIALESLDAVHPPEQRLSELSVGQRYRIRLACLLASDVDFLLLDEPTNHLDAAGLAFLTQQIQQRAGGVILVTHDRALLTDCAHTVVDLDPSLDGAPRVYGDGMTGFVDGRRRERERWEQAYAQQRERMRLLEHDLDAARARLRSGWKPPKGTGKHQRATRAPSVVRSVHRKQEQLEAAAIDVPEPPQMFSMPLLSAPSGITLLRAADLSVTGRLASVPNIRIEAGDRLVVTGPNGAGKSTLLALLTGDLSPSTGAVTRHGQLRLGVLRQETRLSPELRAFEAFERGVSALVARGAIRPNEVSGLSSLGLLRARDARRRVGELSIGQQRRLDLALALATRPNVLILDEPTNHLSMTLVDELTVALNSTPAAVVLSTHDRALLHDVSHWPRISLQSTALQ